MGTPKRRSILTTKCNRGEVEGRGRYAFASKHFKAGEFVSEYRGVVRKKQRENWGDQHNASLGLGCYCLDACV